MKYCFKCGNQMEDDMLFCQKCGTKVVLTDETTPKNNPPVNQLDVEKSTYAPTQKTVVSPARNDIKIQYPKTMRTSMQIWMIICLAFAGLYAVVGIVAGEPNMVVAMSGFFGVLAVMFLVLAKSPKGHPNILDKQNGLKKSIFVLICVIVAFFVLMIGALTSDSPQSQENGQSTIQASSLSDIQKWYEGQMPTVGQNLMEYAKSVDGLSYLNVDESRFLFGGDWDDCYYKFTFTCTVNGENYIGEARAFVKYLDSEIHWFSFEIFDNDGIQSLVELYDESYDQIIVDYYNDLESLYQ